MGLLGFGRKNPFPFTFGGGESTIDVLHEALLDAYAPGWDVSDDTEKAAEAYMQGLAVTFIWVANRRLAHQGQPLKMIEFLTTWEEATGLRPSAKDRPIDRRRRLAAKLRGLVDSTLLDIEAACRDLLGKNFVALRPTALSDEIVYWPGQNPGPPGFEWSSNRCTLHVEVTKSSLSDSEFDTAMGELERLLDGVVPAWMTFTWHTNSAFMVGVSPLGEDGL
jgi:hypothetical protein